MDTKALSETTKMILVSPAIMRRLYFLYNYRTDHDPWPRETFRDAQNLFFLLLKSAEVSDIDS
jgi:hypothetical protein